MKKILLLLFTLLFIHGTKTFASNILGGAINYQFVSSSGNSSTYKVTLELYTTCYFVGMGEYVYPNMRTVTPEIVIKKGDAIFSRPTLICNTSLSGEDITPLCPDMKNASSCINLEGLYPGVRTYVYSAEVVLEGADANWSFNFYGFFDANHRAQVCKFIDNVEVSFPSDPISTYTIYLNATLNNINGPNNSVAYSSPPIPFLCKNKLSYYSVGAGDQDHDELKYKMIAANYSGGAYLNQTTSPVAYFPPFSGERPLPTDTNNFKLDQVTGQLIFTPNEIRTCLVAVQTNEIRNGEVVGTTMRQMTFFINEECNSEPISPIITNVKNSDYTTDENGNVFFTACEGQLDSISFDISVSNPNGNGVSITSQNIPDAANVTIDNDGEQNPVAHFKWDLIDAQPVKYMFFITYSDLGCPFVTSRTVAYTFTVIPHNIKFENKSIGSCLASADGKAWVNPIGETSIDYNYRWVDISTGAVLRNVNSKVGDTLTNIPPGIYKVYVRNGSGCGKNFLINVDTTLLPTVNLIKDSAVCEGMPIELGINPDELETYRWNTGSDSSFITVTQTGNYVLTVNNHCGSSSDSVYLNFVKCKFCLFVPNAFTPNADGNNDELRVIPTCLIYKYKMQIFNRFGQLMFVSYNLEDKWNGTMNGRELEQGTYYYSIEATLDDESKSPLRMKGDVILIK
jgi:gliding motility-associated-like protein